MWVYLSRTNAIVSSIITVFSNASLSDFRTNNVYRFQKNLTTLRNFPRRTVFQDKQLKNYHLIGVPFLSLYAIDIRCDGWDEIFTEMDRRYVVAFGWQIDKCFPPILPVTTLVNSFIQASSGILVHPILVDTEERIIGCLEAYLGVVGHSC